jgi:tetratricopeptide (TPR) repeat protein
MAKQKPSKPQPALKRPATTATSGKTATSPAVATVPPLPGGWMVGALAAVLGFVLYLNTFGHLYVLDDYSAIKDNWVVKGGLKNLDIIFSTEYRYGAWGSPGPLYRPLSLVMFAIEWGLAPDQPWLSHVINVLFYALTGWLLWITWRRILADYAPALAAAAVLLFMAHPVHTEVVANIKSRDEIFAFLMCTAMLYSVWRYFERNSNAWLISGIMAFTLALFCKESSITYLAVLPMAIWFFTKKSISENLKITALMTVPAVIFLIIRHKVLSAQPYPEVTSILDNFMVGAKTMIDRKASAFMMCGRYLMTLAFPHPLNSDMGYPQYKPVGFGDWRALTGFLLFAGMGIWALLNMGRKHILAFAIIYFLATFSPFSNVFITIGTSYGERGLYAPSLGFTLALAWLLTKIFKIDDLKNVWNANGKGNLLWGVLAGILLLYGIKTVWRNTAWYSSYSLYMADLPNSPNCAKLHYHLGLEEAGKGADSETSEVKDTTWFLKAIQTYTRAIELYPEYHDAYGSRGLAYFRLQKYDQALADYETALKHRPNDARVLSNMGFIYFMRGSMEKAEEVYRKSIQYDGRFVDARRNLGAILAMKKQFPQAIEQWQVGLKYEPRNATLLHYIGSAYRDMGQMDKAQPWLDKAKAINPALQ